MAIKRKEKDVPTGAAAPIVKKTRLSATPTTLATTLPITPTPAPHSFAEAKVPALATRIPIVEVKASKKNPSYGFGKPPTNEGIIKALETCIHPGVPLHSLVHPDAAKLYENVNNPEDFFIVSHVFWATFFINQRGCPANLFGNLLTQLLSKNDDLAGAADEELLRYGEVFRRVHDSIQEGFIAATDALSHEWISSPAGVEWLSSLDKARKARKSIAKMRIDETYLKGFIVEEQFYKGIEFINVNRMWRYWGQVLYVTKIQKIGNNSFWPESDIAHGIQFADSLLLRLHRAMIGALVAVINVQAPNHGRVRRILSDSETTRNILRAAYTEGSLLASKTIDGRHIPEHIRMIPLRSLAEWSDHLPTTNDESDENPASSPLSVGTIGDVSQNPLKDWKDGIPQDVVEKAEADEKRAEEVMFKAMKDTVPEYILSDIPFDSIFSAADYPPQRIQPLASALATELTYFNWWGRTYLHIREGKARIQRLEGLMLAARMEIKEIEKREEELEAELKGLESAARMYEDIQKELRTRQENEQSLRHNVRDLKRHPVVDAGVKSFHATSRTRSMSNPESPVKVANVSDVISFSGYEITNNHPNTGERFPDFDLDDQEEEEMISSEDGMSEKSYEEIANPIRDKWGKTKKSGSGNEKIDIIEEKLEEEVMEKEKEMSEDA